MESSELAEFLKKRFPISWQAMFVGMTMENDQIQTHWMPEDIKEFIQANE